MQAKVYIGIPSRNDGSWGMFQSLISNIVFLAQNKIVALIEPHVGDSLICRARQEMTWKFLQTDCTHFMQLDDDIQLPTDGILKLIQADKDMIGGVYRIKNNSGKIASKELEEIDYTKINVVKYLSAGCFLQKREAVERMWKKYKELEYDIGCDYSDNRGKRIALYMPMLHGEDYLSEDWAYCQRATDIGFKMYLHTGVLCGHWGLHNYELK